MRALLTAAMAALLALPPAAPAADTTAVPSPAKVLGYEIGTRFTPHALLERYLFALRDAAPQRMRLVPYGSTNEGRTLYLAVFASPGNLARLDEIRAANLRLADPRTLSQGDGDAIVRTAPAVAWLSYGVHGNEASSTEAAMTVMYRLAAAADSESRFILENLVVVIDPLLNPDGHERFVNYETMRAGSRPVPDRNAAEQSEDWPGGRTNHFYSDLNRDWAWLTQRETRARISAYESWKPQVHVDYHEMGYNSSYFFFPAFKPINRNFPKSTLAWADTFGRANAAAFDARGWSYWSGETFDLFYPGYGDSWPSLNGAIGMTYEQAGGGAGPAIRRSDDVVLTLRDRLEHHAVTSFTTLMTAAARRGELLRDFRKFFSDAIAEGASGHPRTYVLDPAADPARAAKLANTLRAQGVEVSRAAEGFSLGGLRTYFGAKTESHAFPAGSFVIPLDQPARRLAVALMEEEPALTDTFFYDVSTWALPVAYGVPTYWTDETPHVKLEKLTADAPPPAGSFEGTATYAYLFGWESNDAARALIYLLQHNVHAHVAMREFTSRGRRFPRGTIVVPLGGNGAGVHDIMKEAAARFHIDVAAANTGYTERGINLGSDRAVRIKTPKIIVAADAPVGSEAFGALWSMFDQEYGLDFVPMKVRQIARADLHDYNVLIFPDDNADGSGYRSVLDSSAVQKIRSWVAGGGTFIGIEGGAAFAASAKIADAKIKEKAKSDSAGAKQERLMTVEEREHKRRLDDVPGTMLRVKLDVSHPLGFGYDPGLTVFKTSATAFEPSERGYNVGVYAAQPRLSGYMSKENEKLIGSTPFLIHEQHGSGNVVLFADDPNFRRVWDGLNRLFLNSILLIPGIQNVGMTAD